MDYWVVSTLWLLWKMLPETQMYKYLLESLLSVLLGTYSEVELQDQTANLSEKEMATHSSILAWRVPWTEEPGGLQSIGLQRLRHDWSNLARMHTRTANLCLIFWETVKHLSTYPQWLHHFTFLPAMHKLLPILVYTYYFLFWITTIQIIVKESGILTDRGGISQAFKRQMLGRALVWDGFSHRKSNVIIPMRFFLTCK